MIDSLHICDSDLGVAFALYRKISLGLFVGGGGICASGECILFWFAFGSGREEYSNSRWRDFAAIVIANLASFGAGEVLNAWRWFGWLG